jgi:sugar/nucleoside kinase (ribokinase family)
MDFDVIVLGDYCLDLIFTGLESLPSLGTEIEAKGLAMEPGGACNTSLALHRLGVRTAWAVEFGIDDFSKYVLQKFRDEKFPEDLFIISKGPVRKITVSLSYPEDRAFIAYYDPGNMVQTALRGLTTKTAQIVVVPALFLGPALRAGSLVARAKKMDIFMDGNSTTNLTIYDPQIRTALKVVRFFSPNSKEARRLTQMQDIQDAAKKLGEFCQTVIIKDGANGSWCCDSGLIYYEPAIRINAVDTTGAGDCFNAGFIKAWIDKKSIQECLLWGNIAGGLSTQLPGANNYHLSVEEIEKIISRRKN